MLKLSFLLVPLLIGTLGATQGLAQPTSTMKPGCWEYKAKVSIIPVSTDYHQLSSDQIDDFLFNPCTRHFTCTYPYKQIGKGKLAIRGTWTDKKGRPAPVDATGVYTPTTFRLNAKIKTIQGWPVQGQIDAKWVSAVCPA